MTQATVLSKPAGADDGRKPKRLRITTAALFVVSNVVSLSLGVIGNAYVPRIIAAVQGTLDAGPLIVEPTDQGWPFQMCFSGPPLAMVGGDLAPEAFGGEDPRLQIMQAGAAPWNQGHLNLTAFTPDSAPVYIHKFKVIVHKHVDNLAPRWVRDFRGGGCGGPTTRVFSADLDAPRAGDEASVLDTGVEGDDLDSAASAKISRNPLGPAFTASLADPARFRLDVVTCTGYTEWGLRIYYNHAGTEFQKDVGTAQHPFKIVGVTPPVPTYVSDLGDEHRLQPDDYDASCAPRFRIDPTQPKGEQDGTCNNAALTANATAGTINRSMVDELVCRDDYALRHVDDPLVYFSGYDVFKRYGNGWQEVPLARVGANGLAMEALKEAGIDIEHFATVYQDCIAMSLPKAFLMKQCK